MGLAPSPLLALTAYRELRVLERNVIFWSRSGLNLPCVKVVRAVMDRQGCVFAGSARSRHPEARPKPMSTIAPDKPSGFHVQSVDLVTFFFLGSRQPRRLGRKANITQINAPSFRSLTVLAVRHGNGRGEAEHCCGAILWVARSHANLLPRLWCRCARGLDPKDGNIAHGRRRQVIHDTDTQVSLPLGFVFVAPDLCHYSPKDVFTEEFASQSKPQFHQCSALTIDVSRSRSPYVKTCICNCKRWCAMAEIQGFQCSCRVLTEDFGLPRSNAFDHACGFLSETRVAQKHLLFGLKSGTYIVARVVSVRGSFLIGFHHVRNKMNVHLDFSSVRELFYATIMPLLRDRPGI